MASGTQVPWTDPGGTPCCCDSCPTTEDGPDETYSPGTWSNISEGDYNALLAGGTFTLDASINIVCVSSDGAQFSPPIEETAIANLTGIALETRQSVLGSGPCYNQLIPTEPIFTTNTTDYGPLFNPPPPPEQRPLGINFTYALAIVEGTRRISLANAQNSLGQGFNSYVAEVQSTIGLDLPDFTRVVVADPSLNNPSGPQYTESTGVSATVELVMPEATYSASSIARVFYVYFFPGITAQTLTGSISVVVRYSPSAP